jgi:ABC-type antimicrobial peptide transport system permease subunit
MAAIGLYGLVSHAVARRTREMGIRMALGARAFDVIRLTAGSGIRLVLIGTAVGMALAAAVSWLIAGFLYGIRATDLVTFLAIPLILVAIGAMAAWVPARRAALADPVTALRSD